MPIDVKTLSDSISIALENSGIAQSLKDVSLSAAEISRKLNVKGSKLQSLPNVSIKKPAIEAMGVFDAMKLQKNLDKLGKIEFKGKIGKASINDLQNIAKFMDTLNSFSTFSSATNKGIDNFIKSVNHLMKKIGKMKFDKDMLKEFNKFFFDANKTSPGIVTIMERLGDDKLKKSSISINAFVDSIDNLLKKFIKFGITGKLAISGIEYVNKFFSDERGFNEVLKNVPKEKDVKKAYESVSEAIPLAKSLMKLSGISILAGLAAIVAVPGMMAVNLFVKGLQKTITSIMKIDPTGKKLVRARNVLHDIGHVVNGLSVMLIEVAAVTPFALVATVGALVGALALQSVRLMVFSLDKIKIKKSTKKKAVELAALMSSIGITFVAATVAGLLAIPAAVGLLAISGAVLLMGGLFTIINKIKTHVIKGAAVVGVMGLAMFGLAYVFNVVSNTDIKWKNIGEFTLATASVAGVMALAGLAILPIGLGAITVGAMGLGLMAFASSLRIISELDCDYKKVSDNIAGGLSSIMGAFKEVGVLQGIATAIVGSALIPMSLGLITFALSMSVWNAMGKMPVYEQNGVDEHGMPKLKKTGDFDFDPQNIAANIGETLKAISEPFAGGPLTFIQNVLSSVVGTTLIPMSIGLITFAAAIAVWGSLENMQMYTYEGVDEKGNPKIKKEGGVFNLDPVKIAENIGKTLTCLTSAFAGESSGEGFWAGVKDFFGSVGTVAKNVASSVVGTTLIPMSLGLLSFAAAIAVWGNLQNMTVYEYGEVDEHGVPKLKDTGKTVNISPEKVATHITNTLSIITSEIEWSKFNEESKEAIGVLSSSMYPLSRGLIYFAKAIASWGKLERLQVYDDKGDPIGEPIKVDITKVVTNMKTVISSLSDTINEMSTSDNFLSSMISLSNLKELSIALSNYVLSISAFAVLDQKGEVPIINRVTGAIDGYVPCDIDGTVGAIQNFTNKLSIALNSIASESILSIGSPNWEGMKSLAEVFSPEFIEVIGKIDTKSFSSFTDSTSHFIDVMGDNAHYNRLKNLDKSANGIKRLGELGHSVSAFPTNVDGLPKISSMVTTVVEKINTLNIDKTRALSDFFNAANELASPKAKVEDGIEYIKKLCAAIVEELKKSNTTSAGTNQELKSLNDKVDTKNKSDKDSKNPIPPMLQAPQEQTQEIKIYLNDIENMGNGWLITPA